MSRRERLAAQKALAAARGDGVGVDVVAGVLLFAGPPRAAARWRRLLARHKPAIIESLAAPAAPEPPQAELPGVRR